MQHPLRICWFKGRVQAFGYTGSFWFKIFEYGLHIKNNKLYPTKYFSERYKYIRWYYIGDYKISMIKPIKIV